VRVFGRERELMGEGKLENEGGSLSKYREEGGERLTPAEV